MQYCHLNLHNLGCIPGRGESSFITSTRYRLGGSGALSLALAQLQYGIDITVNDSNFFSNSGTRGGIIIVLFTGVNKIQVTFDNCGFERSTMTFFNDVQLPKSIEYRGGSRICNRRGHARKARAKILRPRPQIVDYTP